jgi:Mrp family chromosome partitioning ATPase
VKKMSESCNNDCGSCGETCSDRTEEQKSLLEPLNTYSHVGKVIGVVSGKGGVGKSLVTSLLAVELRQKGYKTAILDGDVTGPSIPKIFGSQKKAMASDLGLHPVESSTGIKLMSVNLVLENENDPVLWRGPLVSGLIKQFWTDVVWEDVDYMLVDMPPGTGDVPLTVFQSLPIDGIVIVTSPQDLVSMIVSKAIKMAEMMNIPVLGLVENYSYVKCPDCGKEIKVFGDSKIDGIAQKFDLEILAKLPIDPKLSEACDLGKIEEVRGDWLKAAIQKIESL